jgi:2-polyprenyl-3-methyl-5-hydroxy-6-metoxy-1,4-benzoquinol methylase
MKPCPICRSRHTVQFDDSRTPRLLICSECRHLFWDRQPTRRELDAFYQATYTTTHGQQQIQADHRAYYGGHNEELMRMVGKDRAAICLADFGCSIPVLLEEAKKQGVGRVIGIDLDRESQRYGSERGIPMLTPAEFFRRTPNGSVDILRFSHVLEHLIDPVDTLTRSLKKLPPRGVLYITQPSFPVFRAEKTTYHVKDSVYPSHLHFFSALSLVRMLEQVPVNVVRFFTVPNHEEVYAGCAHLLDLPYAEKHLARFKECGEAVRGERANYPAYCGENSGLYAVKTEATPTRSRLARLAARVWGKVFANKRAVASAT